MKRFVARLPGNLSLKEAIQQIEQGRYHTGFVLDDSGKYLGIISVNDLRRLIISGVSETDPIREHPCSCTYGVRAEDLEDKEAIQDALTDLTLQGIEYLPVLGANDAIVDVVSVEDLQHASEHPRAASISGLRKQRILIVGGAGFLGSVLTSKLLHQGYTVRILDNFLYGKSSLEQIPQSPALEVIEGDFRNIHTCVSALDNVHAVVLLAAIVGDPASKVRPRATIETNVIAAQALASACKLQYISRFLYASTCSVYGMGGELLDESAELHPVSLYARTKIASEKIILEMGDSYFAPTILRMGTLYGYSPRMRFDLVVNTMTMHAYTEKKIRVFGGKQWRPLLSVQDAAEAYIRCIEADIACVGNQVFNVGSDAQNYQIENIADTIAGTLGGIEVRYDKMSLDVRDYRVSFKKACEQLKFQAADTVAAAAKNIYWNLAQGRIPDPSRKIYYNHFFDVTEE